MSEQEAAHPAAAEQAAPAAAAAPGAAPPPAVQLGLDAPLMVDTGACCANCCTTEGTLLRCSACLHAWYCSQDCQRQHHKDHKPFCKVLKRFSALHSDLPHDIRPKTGHEFYVQRANARRLMEQILRRPLARAEARAIMNEAKCSVCMCTRDQVAPASLACCPHCRWGWVCEQHAGSYLRGPHAEVCVAYRLMNDCHLWMRDMVRSTGKVPSYRPEGLMPTYKPLPEEGWEAYCKWRPVPGFSDAMLAAFSKRLSQPLTALAALQAMYTQQELEGLQQLVVHVVGASAFEVPADGVWEELLHLLPGLQRLHVDFVGPEVADIIVEEDDGVVFPKPLCAGCEKLSRSRSYAYHMCTYQEFLRRQEEQGKQDRPHLAIAFNCGIHETEYLEAWRPALQALIARNTPTCFTSYTQAEAEGDCQAWAQAGGRVTCPARLNPYRATEPILDPSAVDTFYYHSYYWCCGRGPAGS